MNLKYFAVPADFAYTTTTKHVEAARKLKSSLEDRFDRFSEIENHSEMARCSINFQREIQSTLHRPYLQQNAMRLRLKRSTLPE